MVGGPISLSMDMGVQKLSMIVGTMTIMETKVGGNMIALTSRGTMTVTEIMTVIRIAMIKWMMIVMVTIELHLSHKTEITGVLIGLFPVNTSIETYAQPRYAMTN